MKYYLNARPDLSRAMHRISAALASTAPKGVTVTDRQEEADVELLHTIGWQECKNALDRLHAAGKQGVIAQYCFRTAQGDTKSWIELWTHPATRMVWSYYDLVSLCLEDGIEPPPFRFHFGPLGSDPWTFTPPEKEGTDRPWTIATSGYVAETEGVKECAEACRRIGTRFFHLGPRDSVPKEWNADAMNGISDVQLRDCYRKCKWVAGLRRCEGFEMPAVEGLLCGCRPVCFDRPHYRNWFNDYADFVKEDAGNLVVRELTTLFQSGVRPVTPDERIKAAKDFSWTRVGPEFWREVGR